jgi:UDP-N-acetyl-2-amino-2-deoxyglucuronate dehydrogenase
MKKFGLIGAAGYIAPRHMKAIKDTGNILQVALDPNDSVGIIDSYFPQASFFTEVERFDRHIDKLRRRNEGLDYMSICSPNYLHDSHVRLGLRNGCDVICEKPLVINPKNLNYLRLLEDESGKKINNILQLRLHESVVKLKTQVDKNKVYDIDLSYIASRGLWYHYSWKGDESKSGGLATNIGIHFFDMLMWIFGTPVHNEVHVSKKDVMAGYLHLENARVKWFLSCNKEHVPARLKKKGQNTYRSLKINNQEFEFSTGFAELHTRSYEEILKGNGFGVSDAEASIKLAHTIRTSATCGFSENGHHLLK